MLFPNVTYGCEAWTIKKADAQRINSFKLWCYRRVLHVLPDKRTNKFILHIDEIQPKERLLTFVRQRKLCYFGHVATFVG